ncbi:MAG: hypothetical protein HQ518_17975 [Rhodopirellula sp.]|nr:hypothetical protein [Rhodopirellula sp.]
MFTETETSQGQIGSSRRERRRRLLAIQSAADFESQVDDGFAAACESELPVETAAVAASTTEDGFGTSESLISQTASSLLASSANDADRILELLDDVQPHTWVFTGDNLSFEVQQARRGWIEHFSDFVHERLDRKQDIILNSSIADSTIDQLLKDVEWRVLRFQPDVVLLMPSAAECAARGDHSEFQETLHRLVVRLHDEGCTVVLNTPPCPANADKTETTTLRTAASRIRSVATRNSAVLADHFSYWQASLQKDGASANLHDESGRQPSARGHRELARRLLKSLNVRSR